MKKTLSLILAIVMALGCVSITAFAEEPDNTTDITLTVAKSLTYDMVIPEAVSIDAAGVHSVGQAKVDNVKNATEKTVISYTAETTAFKCEGKTDIPASYYTDAQGTTAFPATAVEVYKNKTDAENIPTMYVGISETAWNAAENGTYTATVTFNFEAKEAAAVPESCTITLFSIDRFMFKVNGEYNTSLTFTVPGGSQITSVDGTYLTIQTPTGSYFYVECMCPGLDHWSLDSGDEIVNYEIVGDITLNVTAAIID